MSPGWAMASLGLVRLGRHPLDPAFTGSPVLRTEARSLANASAARAMTSAKQACETLLQEALERIVGKSGIDAAINLDLNVETFLRDACLEAGEGDRVAPRAPVDRQRPFRSSDFWGFGSGYQL